MKKLYRNAYWILPCASVLKDFGAVLVVLSNEPGITEINVYHFRLAQLPGSILFGGSPATIVFNACLAALVGLVVRQLAKP